MGGARGRSIEEQFQENNLCGKLAGAVRFCIPCMQARVSFDIILP